MKLRDAVMALRDIDDARVVVATKKADACVVLARVQHETSREVPALATAQQALAVLQEAVPFKVFKAFVNNEPPPELPDQVDGMNEDVEEPPAEYRATMGTVLTLLAELLIETNAEGTASLALEYAELGIRAKLTSDRAQVPFGAYEPYDLEEAA